MLKQYFAKLWVRRRPTWQGVLAGVLAGAIGGLAGAGAKIVGELIDNPRNLGQVSPPLLFTEKVTGDTYPNLTEQNNIITGIHFTFSIFVGAIYGAAAEVFPIVTVGYGVGFGWVLQLCTHESSVPALGLDVPPWKMPLHEQTSETFTHALFGLAVEVVRRGVRKLLPAALRKGPDAAVPLSLRTA